MAGLQDSGRTRSLIATSLAGTTLALGCRSQPASHKVRTALVVASNPQATPLARQGGSPAAQGRLQSLSLPLLLARVGFRSVRRPICSAHPRARRRYPRLPLARHRMEPRRPELNRVERRLSPQPLRRYIRNAPRGRGTSLPCAGRSILTTRLTTNTTARGGLAQPIGTHNLVSRTRTHRGPSVSELEMP